MLHFRQIILIYSIWIFQRLDNFRKKLVIKLNENCLSRFKLIEICIIKLIFKRVFTWLKIRF